MWTLALFGLLFAVGGGVASVVEVNHTQREIATRDWPSTQARIVESEVQYRPQNRGGKYVPRIKYEYRVDGVAHEGSKIWTTDIGGGVAWASEIARAYPVGATQRVVYSPNNPAEVLAQSGPSPGSYEGLATSLALTVIGTGMLWLAWRERAGGQMRSGHA